MYFANTRPFTEGKLVLWMFAPDIPISDYRKEYEGNFEDAETAEFEPDIYGISSVDEDTILNGIDEKIADEFDVPRIDIGSASADEVKEWIAAIYALDVRNSLRRVELPDDETRLRGIAKGVDEWLDSSE